MKKKAIVITLASVLLFAAGAAGVGIYHISNNVKSYDSLIYPGVKVEDVALSGMTKVQAQGILQEKYHNALIKKKINIKASDKNYTIDYSKLNARYNIDEVVNEAFNYGKNQGMFEKYKLIKNQSAKQINLKFSYDSQPVKNLIAQMEKDINKSPENASLRMVSSGAFSVTSDKKGVKLNSSKLQSDILQKINGELSADIDIQAPIEDVQATITADKLSKVNTKISSYTTDFSTSSANRAANISLATGSINGKLLMPGDSFSFNDVVGKRTAAKGYREAPVIIGNKLDSGLGGGICQVSTTLYNAVMRANVKPTERSHHSLPSHYVGLGMDATVDYGNLDYKFKNTLQYPMYIEGVIYNGKVTFNVYSDSSLASRTYDLVNEVYDTMQPDTKYIDDPNMYEGETQIDQPASIGYKVKVYENTYENGKLIKHELLTNETYAKVDAVIRRGTKKKS